MKTTLYPVLLSLIVPKPRQFFAQTDSNLDPEARRYIDPSILGAHSCTMVYGCGVHLIG
jgi:hypothetical protein